MSNRAATTERTHLELDNAGMATRAVRTLESLTTVLFLLAIVTASLCIGIASIPAHASQVESPGVERVVLLLSEGKSSVSNNQDLLEAGARLRELSVEAVPRRASPTLRRSQQAEAIASQSPLLAVLWIGRRRGVRTLFLYDPQTRRTLVRPLPRDSGDAAAKEELSIVVSATVRSLLEGAQLELEEVDDVSTDGTSETASETGTSPEASSVDAKTQPQPDSAPQRRVGDTVDAAATSWASTWQGRLGYLGSSGLLRHTSAWQNGVSFGFGYWAKSDVHVDLAYHLLPTARLSLGEQTASLRQVPVMLGVGPGVRTPWPGVSWMTAQATLSVNWLTRRTESVNVNLRATPDETRVTWALGARAGVALKISPELGFYGLLGAEIPLSDYEYRVDDGQQGFRSGMLEPRVLVNLGASFSLL